MQTLSTKLHFSQFLFTTTLSLSIFLRAMDSRTRLDHALFHLTPTRTRCDLIISSGSSHEKLASGLLEPFINHLQFAKAEILKGGYSVKLCPPTPADASWFTKATFQRCVQFIGNPQVLERSIDIEKELLHIESSIQSNGLDVTQAKEGIDAKKSSDSIKIKGDTDEVDDVVHEENSKIRLQRLFESRMVLLRKEQAMAYARALVLGFEMNKIDDLVSFANTFGASRLREACINFKEVWLKKHTDRLWMDELAAAKACSALDLSYATTPGIVLSTEDETVPNAASIETLNDDKVPPNQIPSADAKVHQPMPWPNQFPPYMYNNQIPHNQHPFAVMQSFPPYYPGSMQWPSDMRKSSQALVRESHHHYRKTSSRKKNRSSAGSPDDYSQSGSESSSSGSGSESHERQSREHLPVKPMNRNKSKKKSSKTVVIRNINYITSTKKSAEVDGVSCKSSSEETDFVDGSVLKCGEGDSVMSNGNSEAWNTFQTLLMKKEEPDTNGFVKQNNVDGQEEHLTVRRAEDTAPFQDISTLDVGDEKFSVRQRIQDDSFVLTKTSTENKHGMDLENFENGKTFQPSIRKGSFEGEELILSQAGRNLQDASSYLPTESPVIRSTNEEDWFIVNGIGKLGNEDKVSEYRMRHGTDILLPMEDTNRNESKKDVFLDDSIMALSKPRVDDGNDSLWNTDVSMVLDTVTVDADARTTVSSQAKNGICLSSEPDDLCLMPGRDLEPESAGGSWSPKIDYGVEISFSEHVQKLSSHTKSTNDENALKPEAKGANKESKTKMLPGNNGRVKPEIKSKRQFSTNRLAAPKNKLEKEEDLQKRMQEMLIERQKRIAERSVSSGFSAAKSKNTRVENRAGIASAKSGKTGIQAANRSSPRQMKRKA